MCEALNFVFHMAYLIKIPHVGTIISILLRKTLCFNSTEQGYKIKSDTEAYGLTTRLYNYHAERKSSFN